jgi:hypothetical protein
VLELVFVAKEGLGVRASTEELGYFGCAATAESILCHLIIAQFIREASLSGTLEKAECSMISVSINLYRLSVYVNTDVKEVSELRE